ncbi:hypothetical protein [Sphingomonas phage Carli]|nr:hypothetical protein [Sphingomonas phage Carli]
MPSRPLPNLLLQAFFPLGEDGWNDEYDTNFLKLSVLTQATVSGKVAVVPGAPAAGTVIVLDETNPTHPNAVAVYDDGAWVYFTPNEGWLVYDRSANVYLSFDGATWIDLVAGGGGGSVVTESMVIAVGDESTAITAGNGKVTFRMPYGFTVTGVRSSVTAASSSGLVTVDINEGGASILSTKLSIDAGEKTSVTAATAAVISDPILADNAEITIDVDAAGTAAAGLKVYLIGHQ